MKRKVCLSSMSCLALTMAVGLTPVCAKDNEVSTASGTTQVTAQRNSSYKVLIPESIDFLASETSKNFSVKAYGNIAYNQTLKVKINNSSVEMSSGPRRSTATVTFTEASWNGAELATTLEGANDASLVKSGSAAFSEMTAGAWTGTATFDITLDNQ